MTAAGDRDLEQRLHEFTQHLEKKEKELADHPHHAAGQHMGHLVNFRKQHEELKRRLEQPGAATAESSRNVIETEFNSLLDRFDQWVRYVDDEFNQTR
jgi:hypothetical protein